MLTAFDLARRYIGLREYPGGEANPHIVAWLSDAGLPRLDDGTPWCGSFVGHVTHRLLDLPTPRQYARARHWLTVGKPVDLVDASVGFDVVVLKRGDGEQPGPEVLDAPGHVGFFAALEPGFVWLLGGNQGDRVSIAGFPIDRVLGVRRLSEEV